MEQNAYSQQGHNRSALRRNIRVLFIDDNDDDLFFINQALLLKADVDFNIKHVTSIESLERNLSGGIFDIVLSDYNLGIANAIDVLETVKNTSPDTPVIIVSGVADEQLVVEALKHGATDYLMKENLKRLPNAIEKALIERRYADERAKSARTLEQQQLRYAAIFEGFDKPMLLVDSRMLSIVEYNSAAKTFLEAEVSLTDSSLLEFLTTDDQSVLETLTNASFNRKGMFKGYFKTLTHKRVYAQADISVVDVEGITYFYLLITDLSEHKHLEATLNVAKTELEAFLKHFETIGYRISHDIRQPVADIIALTTIARMTNDPIEKTEMLERIELRAKQLDVYIHNLARIMQNNGVELSLKRYSPTDLVKRAAEEVSKYQNLDKISISVDDKLRLFYTCDWRMIEIIKQIISNSAKYHNRFTKQPQLNISFEQANQFALLRFSDNGIGIHRDHIDNVTNLFYRADTFSPGHGVGLFLVADIVKRLGGIFKISSELNNGVTIEIRLPQGLQV